MPVPRDCFKSKWVLGIEMSFQTSYKNHNQHCLLERNTKMQNPLELHWRVLARLGAEVTIVNDGAQAVQAWQAGQFDAILLDISMPVMDGPTALRDECVHPHVTAERDADRAIVK